jgi:hypothetical protein
MSYCSIELLNQYLSFKEYVMFDCLIISEKISLLAYSKPGMINALNDVLNFCYCKKERKVCLVYVLINSIKLSISDGYLSLCVNIFLYDGDLKNDNLVKDLDDLKKDLDDLKNDNLVKDLDVTSNTTSSTKSFWDRQSTELGKCYYDGHKMYYINFEELNQCLKTKIINHANFSVYTYPEIHDMLVNNKFKISSEFCHPNLKKLCSNFISYNVLSSLEFYNTFLNLYNKISYSYFSLYNFVEVEEIKKVFKYEILTEHTILCNVNVTRLTRDTIEKYLVSYIKDLIEPTK